MAQNMNIINLVGQVGDPTKVNQPDGNAPPLTAGKSGELLVSELHGKYYSAAARGNVFHARTNIAGITIPIYSGTANTFLFRNPKGSGRNIEFMRCVLGLTSATEVVDTVGFGIQADSVATTYTTAGLTFNALYGQGVVGVGTLWTATTSTAIAAAGDFLPMFSFSATAATMVGDLEYDFDGSFILTPGYQVLLCGLVAQTAAMVVDLVYAEWPIPA